MSNESQRDEVRFSLSDIINLLTSDNRVTWGPGERPSTVDWVVCNDGTRISVQAGYGYYCEPKNTQGPWTKVEVGPLAVEPTPALAKYMQTPDWGVYAFVPVEVVREFIDAHGGEAGVTAPNDSAHLQQFKP